MHILLLTRGHAFLHFIDTFKNPLLSVMQIELVKKHSSALVLLKIFKAKAAFIKKTSKGKSFLPKEWVDIKIQCAFLTL